MDLQKLRIKLARRRRTLGYTQQQLADRMRITRQYVAYLETTVDTDILVGTLNKWATALGMQVAIGLEAPDSDANQ